MTELRENINTVRIASWEDFARIAAEPGWWEGYNDFAQGRFRYDFGEDAEEGQHVDQSFRYEMGREVAADLRRYCGKIPPWPERLRPSKDFCIIVCRLQRWRLPSAMVAGGKAA